MQRRTLIKGIATGITSLYLSKTYAGKMLGAPYAPGQFEPSWDSLAKYQTPDWYRDAKFGIWAHWGPQCEPEYGDWYAKGMYQQGSEQNKYHVKKYGHPSKFGFKDVINAWKADQWDPEELVALYKKAGAKYFVALANHHDNFDLYNSKHQSWNSTKFGPKKDLIKGWAKAAKNNGLPFGVSVHASHAWTFMEVAQGADKDGPQAGIPYDGKLTKADGKGTWWEGQDPQELYAQNHPVSGKGGNQWDWEGGANIPTKEYCEKFYKRTIQLIDDYNPDLIYFDDTALPLWPINDAGLRIAAHLYNKSIKKHGKVNAVINGKILKPDQRKCMVWDIERGQSNNIEPLPWQTDTCIGGWHYDRRAYDRNWYKSATTVIHTLVDVVSKNGNLLLSVPVRGNGTIDEKERAIVEGIGAWMAVNGESIYGTRHWTVFGEGPAMEGAAPLSAQGFNEGKNKPFTAADIRFNTKGKTLYATLLGWPADRTALIKTLKTGAIGKVAKVELLGHGEALTFDQTGDGLKVNLPAEAPGKSAFVLKIEGAIV